MDQTSQYLDYQRPEQGFVNYAGFWERFAAALLDGLILAVPTGAIQFMYFLPMLEGIEPGMGPEELFPIMGKLYGVAGLLWAAQGLYYAYFESGEKQATWGKQALGIRVTNMGGERISFARAYGRYAARVISGMTCAIGYIMQPFTEKKQALHDMIASTLVVK